MPLAMTRQHIPMGPAVLPGAVTFRTQLHAPREQQRLRVPTHLPVPCKDVHRRMRCRGAHWWILMWGSVRGWMLSMGGGMDMP